MEQQPPQQRLSSVAHSDLTPGSREIGRHKYSTVVNEEFLEGSGPKEEVRYVEVPVYEDVIRHVPRKEVIEREKLIPKYDIQYVDRIVEVPQIQYVDRQVEVPQVVEVVRHVTKKEVIDVPVEVIRNVPKAETIITEKIVEVPGEVIEVPKAYTVETQIPTPNFIDEEVPLVVAQTVKPIITEGKEEVEIDVYEYEPNVVTVDVQVAKPVKMQLIAGGMTQQLHKLVTVPAAQYNTMLRNLNPHLAGPEQSTLLPYVVDVNGTIPLLHGAEAQTPYPISPANVEIKGWVPGTATSTHQFVNFNSTIATTTVQPSASRLSRPIGTTSPSMAAFRSSSASPTPRRQPISTVSTRQTPVHAPQGRALSVSQLPRMKSQHNILSAMPTTAALIAG